MRSTYLHDYPTDGVCDVLFYVVQVGADVERDDHLGAGAWQDVVKQTLETQNKMKCHQLYKGTGNAEQDEMSPVI
jgi:hypothetical protein